MDSSQWFIVLTYAVVLGILQEGIIVVGSIRDTIELPNMEENPGSVGKSGLIESQKTALLQLHNAFRSIVRPTASNMIRMAWDNELEKIASDFADKCLVAHNPDRHKQAKHYDWVGENIAWGTGLCGDKECGDVFEGVKRWFSESKNYNFITGQCSGKCTLYTQMAWWESNKLGCGAKRCGDRTILVCNYAPGGNYVGQKPYRQGKACSDCPKGSICDNNLCVPPEQQGTCRDCISRSGSQSRQDLSSNMEESSLPLETEATPDPQLLPEGWHQLPVHLVQIDSGLTQNTWGINARNTPFLLELDNALTRVNGTLHHVSSGQSGIWGIGLLGNIFLRTGISEDNPRGLYWERVRGNLKQIDSGPTGIVWGVNRFDKVFCRLGISPQSPTGTGWRLIEGSLKYISCGEFGCWGVDRQGTIFFRKGVTGVTPQGAEWMTIPGSLRMIESGPQGVTVGVRETVDGVQDVLFRTGVTSDKPQGEEWFKLPIKLSHVTVGSRGIMGIMHNGVVVVHRALQISNDVNPTQQPDLVSGTKAVPLDEQAPLTPGQVTTPAATRTFPLTTPATHTQPLLPANADQVGSVSKHIDNDSVKEQEKEPLKMTPEMANKLLHMIQEKGNQFEMTHKAAAERMQHNISAAAAPPHQASVVENKLVSPPQPQSSMKNISAASQQAAAPAQPMSIQQQKPVQAIAEPTKEDTGLPTVGGAFQNALLKGTKTTSENSAQLLVNKTEAVQQASNAGPSPAKPLSPNAEQQTVQGSVAAQPHPGTVQELAKPVVQPPQSTVEHQQDTKPLADAKPLVNAKPVADASQNAPAQSQSAQAANLNHQTADEKLVSPAVSIGQPVKDTASLLPNKKPAGQQQAVTPVQSQGPPAQPQAAAATQLKPAVAASIAPTHRKPTPAVIHAQANQQQQPTASVNKEPTRPRPTHRPTAAATLKVSNNGAQLATATRPENIHHVFQPTASLYRPTPPSSAKGHQNVMQHFPTRGKYRDEDYDIGLIGRKHLNEISSGVKVARAPTPKPTQKPIRTAPVTHAVTVSYELTRSCCAIPDSVCPIPHDCKGYIECKGYNGFYRMCERGKMFHPFKNICDYPRNVDCEAIKAGGATANAQDNAEADFAVQNTPMKSELPTAPAEAKLSPGPDFLELEESLPQRSGVHSSETGEMTGEIPQPRITAPDGGNSGVLREVWFGVGLSPHLKDLINNPRFPQTPDEYLILDKFEAPPNAGDGYGQRLSTYFRAPETGEYLFYLSCDNECELWLSPDTDELNSNMTIELKNGHFTSFRQWNKYPLEQASHPVKLQMGRFYFMESFMKEGTGGDNLSIGMRYPDGKTELPIINNLYLIPALTGPASADKNLKSGRTKQLLENSQYNNLPVQENYLERPDRIQDVESDLDMFNARKRTSVRRDSE